MTDDRDRDIGLQDTPAPVTQFVATSGLREQTVRKRAAGPIVVPTDSHSVNTDALESTVFIISWVLH